MVVFVVSLIYSMLEAFCRPSPQNVSIANTAVQFTTNRFDRHLIYASIICWTRHTSAESHHWNVLYFFKTCTWNKAVEAVEVEGGGWKGEVKCISNEVDFHIYLKLLKLTFIMSAKKCDSVCSILFSSRRSVSKDRLWRNVSESAWMPSRPGLVADRFYESNTHANWLALVILTSSYRAHIS